MPAWATRRRDHSPRYQTRQCPHLKNLLRHKAHRFWLRYVFATSWPERCRNPRFLSARVFHFERIWQWENARVVDGRATVLSTLWGIWGQYGATQKEFQKGGQTDESKPRYARQTSMLLSNEKNISRRCLQIIVAKRRPLNMNYLLIVWLSYHYLIHLPFIK